MVAVKLKGKITSDRKLIVDLPKGTLPGLVEVIVLRNAPTKPAKRRTRRKITHPAFGMWADRKEIVDSSQYAAELRRKIENRQDARR
jgi:hypothetical protein